jgi:hypothetical protein
MHGPLDLDVDRPQDLTDPSLEVSLPARGGGLSRWLGVELDQPVGAVEAGQVEAVEAVVVGGVVVGRDAELLGRVWPDGHPSSQISSEAITTIAR